MNTDDARKRLEEERARLRETLTSLESDAEAQKDSLSELSVYDEHQGDIGTETFEQEKNLSITESVRGELDAVDAAFSRIEAGTYGQCEICHRPIGDDRLEAVPAARFCVEHQAEMEGTGVNSGT